ncbi:hypothetical protein M3Y98_01195600 [Aphelenchoides besseyi]|nr:hypothetical protein M3Y98_01195600 [Aphelenchoides besseyi]KAI6193167.1 hypothetical protein M3Y96_00989800 [Aphelenchoides besseyi]
MSDRFAKRNQLRESSNSYDIRLLAQPLRLQTTGINVKNLSSSLQASMTEQQAHLHTRSTANSRSAISVAGQFV